MENCIKREKRRQEALLDQSRAPSHRYHNLEQNLPATSLSRFLAKYAERVGTKTYDFVRRHWLGIINLHLFIFIGGSLIAPLFSYFDEGWTSKIIYGFYRLFCHQKASRSFFLLGNQVALCSRCVAFYSSLLLFGLWMSLKRMKPLDLKLGLLLISPAVVDVFLQALQIRESNSLIRVTTGALLGLAFALYFFPRAQKAIEYVTRDGKLIP